MNYYERHIGDYLKDTAHLSLLEHGIYARLLDVYYTKEVGIEDGMVARLIGARSDEELQALRVVLMECFTLEGGIYLQARCDREIARYQDKQRKAKKSADVRWGHTERNANALPTHSEGNALQSPDPDPVIEKELSVPSTRPTSEVPALSLVADAAKEPPACPHLEVLSLWAEVLPSMPQHLPSMWKGQRADHLRVRWRETAVEKGWGDKAQGLAYFRKLFGYVGQSAFLTGRAKTDKRPFVIELEWLVLPTNWAKVIEGKYHQEAA